MYNSQIKGVLDKNFIETDKPSQIISMAILSQERMRYFTERLVMLRVRWLRQR